MKAEKERSRAFQGDQDDALLRLALLKEREDYRAYFAENIDNAKDPKAGHQFFEEMRLRFGLLPSGYAGRPFEEWSSFLDPNTDAKDAPETVRRAILPWLFYWPGVREVVSLTPPESVITVLRGKGECPRVVESAECAPYERLYKVDLRKKTAQLLQEFEAALEAVDAYREKNPAAYSDWKRDRSRKREEAWRDLKIYRLWRDKETFPAIAEKLGMDSPEKVKQAFYKIFEQINDRPYGKDEDRSEMREAPTETKGLCLTCSDRSSCTGTCDALDEHLRKHTSYRREDYAEETVSDPTPEEGVGRKKVPPRGDDMK